MKQYIFFSNNNFSYTFDTSAYQEISKDTITISSVLNCIVTDPEKKFLLKSEPNVIDLVARGVISFVAQDDPNIQEKQDQARTEYYKQFGSMICNTLDSIMII